MVKHTQYVRDGQPVKRKLVASFPGPDYEAQRDEDTLNVFWSSDERADGELRLIASFEGQAYIAEREADGLVVYLLTTENVQTGVVGDYRGYNPILGAPGPKTARAMAAGKGMSGERLQALSEAMRRGEAPQAIRDRNPNPKAVAMQARAASLRREWEK